MGPIGFLHLKITKSGEEVERLVLHVDDDSYPSTRNRGKKTKGAPRRAEKKKRKKKPKVTTSH